MSGAFSIAAAAGSLRDTVAAAVVFDHQWTDAGVAVQAPFTGAHLLHLAAAGCVLNDLYREAAAAGLRLDGVRVDADGDFDPQTWRSTGIAYRVTVDSPEPPEAVAALLGRVEEIAEIPRAIRAGAPVERLA